MSFVLRRGIKAVCGGLLGPRRGFLFSALPKEEPPKLLFMQISEPVMQDRSFLGRVRVQTGLDLGLTIMSLQKESVKEFLNRSKSIMPFLVTQENLELVALC